MKKLMVFVDNAYLVHEARRLGIKLSHKKLVNFLANQAFIPYDITRAILYCSIDRSVPDDQIECMENLYDTINRFPNFEVKKFYLKLIYGDKGQIEKKVEKGVDVALATDLVAYAHLNAYDVAIVCSGDEDFIPCIEHVKNIGKEVYVASCEESSSVSLIDASLGWVSLTKNALQLGELYSQSYLNNYNRVFVRENTPVVADVGVKGN